MTSSARLSKNHSRRFWNFAIGFAASSAGKAEGLTPLEFLVLIHVKGRRGRSWAGVSELAERLQAAPHAAGHARRLGFRAHRWSARSGLLCRAVGRLSVVAHIGSVRVSVFLTGALLVSVHRLAFGQAVVEDRLRGAAGRRWRARVRHRRRWRIRGRGRRSGVCRRRGSGRAERNTCDECEIAGERDCFHCCSGFRFDEVL